MTFVDEFSENMFSNETDKQVIQEKLKSFIEQHGEEYTKGYIRAIVELTDQASHIVYIYDATNTELVSVHSQGSVFKKLRKFVDEKHDLIDICKSSLGSNISKNTNQPD